MAYSTIVTSQCIVILPSFANPYSWYILSSSLKIIVLRYGNGTPNLLPSAVYTVQCPLSATREVEQHVSSSLVAVLTL
ncbi:hypothetical protein SETIT_2G295700v2 [Setaria italica]|uniref:Uncharacterized protein n=1 Tax=Setaria italica TaxID=4555 RepID=K4A2F7_SETIT|nr:hypothetical protein SETIT_2G295700v2 [Setaria italica]